MLDFQHRGTPQIESRVYVCSRQNLPYFQHYPTFNTYFGVKSPQNLTKSSTLNPHLPYFQYTLLSICSVLVPTKTPKKYANLVKQAERLRERAETHLSQPRTNVFWRLSISEGKIRSFLMTGRFKLKLSSSF